VSELVLGPDQRLIKNNIYFMEKFKVLKKIGDGSFGVVIQAQDQTTDEMVAIKKMKQKYPTWEECINLRELKAL
jgi:protein kinase